MQTINGCWVTGTYLIPEKSNLYIHSYRGTYSLMCEAKKDKWYHKLRLKTIRYGIIDFKRCN